MDKIKILTEARDILNLPNNELSKYGGRFLCNILFYVLKLPDSVWNNRGYYIQQIFPLFTNKNAQKFGASDNDNVWWSAYTKDERIKFIE